MATPTEETPGEEGSAEPLGHREPPLLAEAKLAAPRPRAGMVRRPRVLKALDAGAAVTLLAAPPGYGKTTAVRVWSTTQPAALAWITLDAGDNDAVLMWMYI